MFFFKNRRKYNGSIDELLNNGYHIPTQSNDKFPGALKYLGMIDLCWQERYTELEAALFIATLYYSGLKSSGHHHDARMLAPKISAMGQSALASGGISMERLTVFMAAIEKANLTAPSPPAVANSTPLTRAKRSTSSSLLNSYGGLRKTK